jgi:hypothetical protein
LPGGEVGGYHFEPMKPLSDSSLVLCWVAVLSLNVQAGPPTNRGLGKGAPMPVSAGAVSLVKSGEGVEATAPNYHFGWTAARQGFRLADPRGRTIASDRIAPVITVQPLGKAGARKLVSATVQNWSLEGEQLKIGHREASGIHDVEIAIRFALRGIWLEPIWFQAGDEDVVTARYFSRSDGQAVTVSDKSPPSDTPGIDWFCACPPALAPWGFTAAKTLSPLAIGGDE